MYEIIELDYNKELLQTYINKKGYIFLGFIKEQMVFKVKKVTSRQLVAKKEADKFFEQFQDIKNPVIDNDLMSKLADELGIEWINEKRLLATFLNFRLHGKNEGKTKWKRVAKKDGTFDLASRFRTFMGNKKDTPKKSATITTF